MRERERERERRDRERERERERRERERERDHVLICKLNGCKDARLVTLSLVTKRDVTAACDIFELSHILYGLFHILSRPHRCVNQDELIVPSLVVFPFFSFLSFSLSVVFCIYFCDVFPEAMSAANYVEN